MDPENLEDILRKEKGSSAFLFIFMVTHFPSMKYLLFAEIMA